MANPGAECEGELMELPKTWMVTKKHGPRPAGPPDACFYCQEVIGAPHASTCVMVERTVVVRLTIDLVRQQPASWTPKQINFHHSESSWCKDNILNILKNRTGDCLCPTATIEYVREATLEDHEKLPREAR